MARKQQKSLVKTAAALAATALVEKAIQKAAEDPRVRRKAKAVGKAVKKRVTAAGKKLTRAIQKRAPKLARARAKGRKRARA
jgi:hypothetical protein